METIKKEKLLKNEALNNPILKRAFEKLKENKEKENHVCHYTKHGSHATHSKGSW